MLPGAFGWRGLGLELIAEIKLYDLTFLSVLEIKGSLLNILSQTSYPEIDSKFHDENFLNVQKLTGLPSQK